MSSDLLSQLAQCNLEAAAFDFNKHLTGRVYKADLVDTAKVFMALPCPETALNLVIAYPQFLPIIMVANDRFVRNTPKECRGPMLQGFEECMESIDINIRSVSAIQEFLCKEASCGRIRIGFHKMRDQSRLYDRLRQIGIRKGFLRNRQQFLRDTITKNASAYRAVFDMVCINCVHEGRPRFWNGLGAESDQRLHHQSEIFYEIGQVVTQFEDMLSEIKED